MIVKRFDGGTVPVRERRRGGVPLASGRSSASELGRAIKPISSGATGAPTPFGIVLIKRVSLTLPGTANGWTAPVMVAGGPAFGATRGRGFAGVTVFMERTGC